MFFKWLPKKSGRAALPPENPEQSTPALELEHFGPVARANHIAYVPAKSWAGVPGAGTSNLAYIPDFLLTPPAWIAGAGILRPPNTIRLFVKPAVIVQPKRTIEGIGGIVAGQIVHQPLLQIDIENGQSGVGGE